MSQKGGLSYKNSAELGIPHLPVFRASVISSTELIYSRSADTTNRLIASEQIKRHSNRVAAISKDLLGSSPFRKMMTVCHSRPVTTPLPQRSVSPPPLKHPPFRENLYNRKESCFEETKPKTHLKENLSSHCLKFQNDQFGYSTLPKCTSEFNSSFNFSPYGTLRRERSWVKSNCTNWSFLLDVGSQEPLKLGADRGQTEKRSPLGVFEQCNKENISSQRVNREYPTIAQIKSLWLHKAKSNAEIILKKTSNTSKIDELSMDVRSSLQRNKECLNSNVNDPRRLKCNEIRSPENSTFVKCYSNKGNSCGVHKSDSKTNEDLVKRDCSVFNVEDKRSHVTKIQIKSLPPPKPPRLSLMSSRPGNGPGDRKHPSGNHPGATALTATSLNARNAVGSWRTFTYHSRQASLPSLGSQSTPHSGRGFNSSNRYPVVPTSASSFGKQNQGSISATTLDLARRTPRCPSSQTITKLYSPKNVGLPFRSLGSLSDSRKKCHMGVSALKCQRHHPITNGRPVVRNAVPNGLKRKNSHVSQRTLVKRLSWRHQNGPTPPLATSTFRKIKKVRFR